MDPEWRCIVPIENDDTWSIRCYQLPSFKTNGKFAPQNVWLVHKIVSWNDVLSSTFGGEPLFFQSDLTFACLMRMEKKSSNPTVDGSEIPVPTTWNG